MFDDYELSARGGKPTHMFLFGRQSVAWRFIGCDRDQTIGGQLYTAAPISRSEIKQTVEKAQDNITITLPYNRDPGNSDPVTQSLGDQFFPYVPGDTVTVICMAVHLNDPDLQATVEWMGQVGQPKFTDGQLELTCVPTGSIGVTRNQGAKWQVGCWKTVYSTGIRGCNLIRGAAPVVGNVTAITGNAVTAAEWVPQQRTYVGGTATWMNGTTQETANITAANGSTLTLDNVSGIAVGTSVTASTTSLETATTLSAVSGLTLTSSDFSNTPFNLAGGGLEFTNADGIVERLSIMAHSGSSITVLSGSPSLAVGLQVTVYPGCDRTWAACAARGNTVNYGGAIYEPVQNPYDGQSMSWSS